jgi:simple sugar transport system substrate-binding protein
MTEHQQAHEAQSGVDPSPREVSRRRFLGHAAAVGVSVPALSFALNAFGGEGTASAADGPGKNPFPSTAYSFTLVNHVTTNSFFVPTQYGAQDACTLLGCSYNWVGSQTSDVTEMVNAMNTAINRKVAGIGIPIIDPTAFNTPTDKALAAGIPVVSYNAKAPDNSGNNALSYVGQDLTQAGVQAGKRILSLVKKGDLVGGMIATPGSLNIQPRIDGAASVLNPAGINFVTVATGAAEGAELSAVDAWYQGHTDVKFLYAVDAGSGIAVATAAAKYNLKSKGVNGSGWDVGVPTLQQVKKGNLTFTIDQQAYLQGFLTIMQLFLYQISGGLLRPVDTDTGLLFVTPSTVGPYLSSSNRYEGASKTEKVVPAPSSIKV